MKNKKIHLILTIFSLVVFFTMPLLFMGCHQINKIFFGEDSAYYEKEREQIERAVAEREAKEEEKKQTEVEEETSAEEVAEKEMSFPNEPVTYTGNLSGLPVTLTVNFKTTEVTGSMPSLAKGFPDTIVTDGTIYLDTLEIYAFFTGVSEMDSDGNVIETSWLTMTGKISDDLIKINVETLNEEGESGELTLTR